MLEVAVMKNFNLFILISMIYFIFCSCKYEQIELISERTIDSTKSNNRIVAKVTPTIDLEKDLSLKQRCYK